MSAKRKAPAAKLEEKPEAAADSAAGSADGKAAKRDDAPAWIAGMVKAMALACKSTESEHPSVSEAAFWNAAGNMENAQAWLAQYFHANQIHVVIPALGTSDSPKFPVGTTKEVFHLPFTALKMQEPDDGWGNRCDLWSTFQGMLAVGCDLRREPLDVKFDLQAKGAAITPSSATPMKGNARITCMLRVLRFAMQLEPGSPDLLPVRSPCQHVFHRHLSPPTTNNIPALPESALPRVG